MIVTAKRNWKTKTCYGHLYSIGPQQLIKVCTYGNEVAVVMTNQLFIYIIYYIVSVRTVCY